MVISYLADSGGQEYVGNDGDCSGCIGCSHIDTDHGWCYMFLTPPDILPCGQHDKYKVERAVMGKLIKRYPWLLELIVASSLPMKGAYNAKEKGGTDPKQDG